jgi:exosortase C (VPDSG-CTERM-specific)
LISAYLIWRKRHQLAFNARPSRKLAVFLFAIGSAVLVGHYRATASGLQPAEGAHLALMTLVLLIFLWGACLFFFGVATVRAIFLPLALLVFAVPFPDAVLHQLQTFLQIASASAAHLLFQISDTPVLRQGTSFQLPGFSLEVALECSGIHSSLVLLITSFLAAHLVLRKLWTKALLVLFVIPLAIIRNGIRVFTIAQLCIHIGPEMFHSYIHQHGGPIFFIGSLIPFLLLMLYLNKLETRGRRNPGSKGGYS